MNIEHRFRFHRTHSSTLMKDDLQDSQRRRKCIAESNYFVRLKMFRGYCGQRRCLQRFICFLLSCSGGWASPLVLVVKNPPATAGGTRDAGSIPGSRRSPGEGNGTQAQCSCLENSMGRGSWATVLQAARSQTWVSWLNQPTGLCTFFPFLIGYFYLLRKH